MGQRMNPAVAAGLIGSATFVMPETAQALSLTELVDATFATPTAAFAAGAAGGGGGAGGGAVAPARRGGGPRAAAGGRGPSARPPAGRPAQLEGGSG